MSQENVEIVREVMALLSTTDTDPATKRQATERLADLFAAEVVVDMSRRVFNPDVYKGLDGLRRLAREMQTVWEAFTITPERFLAAGDRVVVIETRRGRGRSSGVEVEQRAGVIWTLRDGQVVRMETDLDPQEALEA